jgi:hypothetical protein
MSWKSFEEFEKAVETSYEEYEAMMLKTGQWKTAEEQYAIEAAVDALTADDLEYYGGC